MRRESISGYASADWLAARAAVAGRRTRRFALAVSAVFVLSSAGLVVFVRDGPPPVGGEAALEAGPDTLLLSQSVARLARELSGAEARLDAALRAAERQWAHQSAGATARAPGLDSLQAAANALDSLLDRARTAPLSAAYRALAAAEALRREPRARALSDSLDELERRRAALRPTPEAAVAEIAELAARANEVGRALVELGERRRTELARELSAADGTAGARAPAPDTAGPRRSRDSVRTALAATDSLLSSARLALVESASRSTLSLEPAPSARSRALASLAALFLTTLAGGFGYSLAREIRNPTISSVREAEVVSGTPVVAVLRDDARAPRPGIIDPFRVLYLGLTATGTRARTVVVCADAATVAAIASGRLALAAAADSRATLLVDAEAEASPLAAYYGESPEPGFTDVIAGVRLWREVARPVAANAGMLIDVVTGGTIREAPHEEGTLGTARAEFARFRGEYDLTVVAAPTDTALARVEPLLSSLTVVLCWRLDRTPLREAHRTVIALRQRGASISGVLLWTVEPPALPSRPAMLARALARRASPASASLESSP